MPSLFSRAAPSSAAVVNQSQVSESGFVGRGEIGDGIEVYPAIFGGASSRYESWRKASRYARTAGRQADTLEGHRPDARTTPAADIETISLQKIVNPWNAMLCEAAGGTTSASSAFPRSERVYPAIRILA